MKPGGALLTLLALTGLLAWRFAPAPRPHAGWCASPTSARVAKDLVWLKDILASPDEVSADYRYHAHFPNDSSNVTLVQNDSICRRAAVLVYKSALVVDTTWGAIWLYSISNKAYWAVDSTRSLGGRYPSMLALDSALTTIYLSSSR